MPFGLTAKERRALAVVALLILVGLLGLTLLESPRHDEAARSTNRDAAEGFSRPHSGTHPNSAP